MKLAFCIYKYFPYGGLQRDFIRMARECQSRGHEVRVYALRWLADLPDDLDVTFVPVRALFNHNLYRKYSEWLAAELKASPVDCVVGFNKMPGLDVYYAADSCFEEKARTQRGPHYRLLPRYRHFASFEKSVFGQGSKTEILSISEVQKPCFIRHYRTEEARMHTLPPGISRDRIAPDNAEEIREEMRSELGLKETDKLVLFLGSGFIKKGLARAIDAVASLSGDMQAATHLYVVGEDRAGRFKKQVQQLGIGSRVHFMGGREDVPRWLLGADLLLHPASDENAGMVLLEAIVSGLPVLATEICGYAHYVTDANMGRLVPEPFSQAALDSTLAEMLARDDRQCWRNRGKAFAQNADIYSLPEHAVDIIERVMHRKAGEDKEAASQ